MKNGDIAEPRRALTNLCVLRCRNPRMHLHSKSKLALWAGPSALALLAAVNACSGKISSNPDGLGLGATGGSPAASGSGGTSGSMGGSTSSVAVGGSGGSGAQGGSAVIVVGDMGGTG